jgi:NAD(P)-dependent dehydrogenase (short-subunit alcohol dehydrogenase family)
MAAVSELCEGRVCVVTGAAQGIGRAHVEALAAAGARVVVNDVDAAAIDETVAALNGGDSDSDGTGTPVAAGHVGDVSTAAGADGLLATALATWGRLDVVVNNAGIARDRMLVNLSEDDWDAVVGVHLRSTFLVTQRAARHWRERAKSGETVDARVVNTVSSVGLYGHVGQANYGAAKAAIASFTLTTAMELGRYGATVNALCPTALTPMTEAVGLGDTDDARSGALDPRWVSPALVWLASPLSADVTGRVIVASGKRLAIAEGWRRGPTGPPVADPADVDAAIRPLLAAASPNADVQGDIPTEVRS